MKTKWRNYKFIVFFFLALNLFLTDSYALPVPQEINAEVDRRNLLPNITILQPTNNLLKVKAAPNNENIVKLIEIKTSQTNRSSHWAVFALENKTDEQIDKLLVAPHYLLKGSGLILPDLGGIRINNITASEGFTPERKEDKTADVFHITLDPGSVVTFIAELNSSNLASLELWDPSAYQAYQTSYKLYYGILLGIIFILSLISVLFSIARTRLLFYATALLTWSGLLYLILGTNLLTYFNHSALINIATVRAASELLFSLTLGFFLLASLNLYPQHLSIRSNLKLLLYALGAYLVLILLSPEIAATLARISLFLISFTGLISTLYFAKRGFSNAIMLLPSWLTLCLYSIFYFITIIGLITSDLAEPILNSLFSISLIIISFVILKKALTEQVFKHSNLSNREKQALGFIGADDILWEFSFQDNSLSIYPNDSYESASKQYFPTIDQWLEQLYPADRSQLTNQIGFIRTYGRGQINQTIRIKNNYNQYSWYWLRARPVINAESHLISCVGSIIDITPYKEQEKDILLSPLYDKSTLLPRSTLFLNHLSTLISTTNYELETLVLNVYSIRIHAESNQTSETQISIFLINLNKILPKNYLLSRLSKNEFAILSKLSNHENVTKDNETVLFKDDAYPHAESFVKAALDSSALQETTELNHSMISQTNAEITADEMLQKALANLFNKAELLDAPLNNIHTIATHFKVEESKELTTIATPKYHYQTIVTTNKKLSGLRFSLDPAYNLSALMSQHTYLSTPAQSNWLSQISEIYTNTINNIIEELDQQHAAIDEFLLVIPIVHPDLIDIKWFEYILTQTNNKMGGKIKIAIEVNEYLFGYNATSISHFLEKLTQMGVIIILDYLENSEMPLIYFSKFDIHKIYLPFELKNSADHKDKILYQSLIDIASDFNIEIILKNLDLAEINPDSLDCRIDYLLGDRFNSQTDVIKYMRSNI